MATATQKITLSSSRDIPFNKLVLSQSNVRRIKAGVSIEDLAVSIARRGLIQSLHVRPVLDAEGQETGMFEVPAGGRRYQALAILVKQKRLAKTAPVPCVVGDAASGILMEEISFAENDERVPPHPLDQYRAFQTMRDKGMTEEDIAAAFLIDVNVVKQRLRLASISSVLLDIYAEDGIELKQLMAFTVSQDHARQEQVWAAIKDGWQKEPWQIRRMLTETAVRASDKRAAFVGIDAYEAAGGYLLRDLFEDDHGGWLQDPVLLDRLVGEKLKTIAEEIAGEGWKWVEIAVNFPYGHDEGLRELVGTTANLTDEERAAREALRDEHDRLEAEYAEADDLPDEIDHRLGEIEQSLDAFEQRPMIYDPAEIARAGVFVSIDRDGDLVVDRGYVRPEDEAPLAIDGEASNDDPDVVASEVGANATIQRAVTTIGGQPVEPEEDDEEDVIKPLPERLVIELTAHRSLALRDAVGANPHVALTALLHKLVRDTFQRISTSGASLQASVNQVSFREQDKDLAEAPYAKSATQRHEEWKTDIPADDDALWDWLAVLDETSRLALLAHCVAYGVNALYERPNPHSATGISQAALDRRMAEADRLARSTGLDMVDAGFRPTVENYLGRVTKPRILAAVREGAGERAAQLIVHLKKGDMAVEAERLLADTGWLPEPLRLADLDGKAAAEVTAAEADGAGEALPDFLAGDDEDDMDDADNDDDHGATIAAA
ncbi:chromosome partitioning protein ParB [Agrobacterium vitis]|uniref:Chromosome partitioning protein ParB n=1 Tax=Agrobacterium vitis TaxID=373 RepID=A0A1S2EA38_AGRVI|nr:ParB/RepB/Spo0J family partition protein [Agrobacterium vitis]MCM2467273.1 ParB/RepB/Spo0J family partition protein [Agrobacterium vitis]MUO68821.1 chromosome partitioning protein ParB [Agrobacterium vitis]MUO79764.1 chromosome partitioning protein ParB [Agrobacterium vitis]MUO93747.1 chromosome partitioning protein ParB [Agrobacterium vitis]MUP04002.1 chromosome partitioning protein ParB [Agrobacterium vitis]